jgi:hypothetical protein
LPMHFIFDLIEQSKVNNISFYHQVAFDYQKWLGDRQRK